MLSSKQVTASPRWNPDLPRCCRARSGSKRSAISGVWPSSAGGTMPPVATTMFIGMTSASARAQPRISGSSSGTPPAEPHLVLVPTRDSERSADHLPPELRPMHSTRLDGVAGLGAAVGPVHHAHEVGRRRHKPELDGPVVEGVHPDPVGVGVVAQVVVLPVLQDEIDRHGRARAPRIQY